MLSPALIHDNKPPLRCRFCGRARSKTGPMVEGWRRARLCRECATAAVLIYEQTDRENAKAGRTN